MKKISILAVLLVGCTFPPPPSPSFGKAGQPCQQGLTCDPGLQCQVNSHFTRCVPIGKPLP